ncbi:hypothetical protein D3C80_1413020 [compost metagenome]
MQDVLVLAGVGISDPAHALPLRRHLGQTRQAKAFSRAPGGAAVVGLPLTVEQQLPVAHHRPLHLHHHFVPFAGRLTRRPELVGNARPPHHCPTFVNQ